MEGQGKIEHSGVVESVSGHTVRVSFISRSACGDCRAKHFCVEGSTQERFIDVTDASGEYHPGDHVKVVMKESQGVLAISLGYLLPFLVMIVLLVLIQDLTKNELIAGLLALAGLALYFVILYFFRNRIKRTFTFELEKNTELLHE